MKTIIKKALFIAVIAGIASLNAHAWFDISKGQNHLKDVDENFTRFKGKIVKIEEMGNDYSSRTFIHFQGVGEFTNKELLAHLYAEHHVFGMVLNLKFQMNELTNTCFDVVFKKKRNASGDIVEPRSFIFVRMTPKSCET